MSNCPRLEPAGKARIHRGQCFGCVDASIIQSRANIGTSQTCACQNVRMFRIQHHHRCAARQRRIVGCQIRQTDGEHIQQPLMVIPGVGISGIHHRMWRFGAHNGHHTIFNIKAPGDMQRLKGTGRLVFGKTITEFPRMPQERHIRNARTRAADIHHCQSNGAPDTRVGTKPRPQRAKPRGNAATRGSRGPIHQNQRRCAMRGGLHFG